MNKVHGAAILRPPDPPFAVIEWAQYAIWTGASLFSVFIEMLVRPRFSSRYFSPVVVVVALVFAEIVGALSVLANYIAPSTATVGMGVLVLAFRLVVIAHGFRLLPVFRDMNKERFSLSDGDGLAVFGLLPRSDSWLLVRCAYEPMAVIAVAIFFYSLGILSGIAALYLAVGALALTLKIGVVGWNTWVWRRKDFDQRAIGDDLAGVDARRPSASEEPDFVVRDEHD